MSDQHSPLVPPDAPAPGALADVRPESAGRIRAILGHLAADVTVATLWAALIVAIVLFSGVVSQFAYVDF